MKIGDLFVKLGLKKDEFSRGMKEAGGESKSLLSVIKGIGGGAKIAFAAVSAAVVGAIATVKELSKQNQVLGDTIGRFTAGMSAMFDTLKTSIASLNFSNLISDLREANRLARDLYDAQDAMGEINTSYNISLSRQLKHINELRVGLRNQNLTDDERIAKGKELLKIYEDLEKNRTRGQERVMEGTLDYYMQRVGVNMKDRTDSQLKAMRNKFTEFFEWLGTKEGEQYLQAAEQVNKNGGLNGYFGRTMMANATKAGKGDFARLAIGYSAEMGDENRLQVEKAIADYYHQEARYSEETLRIQQEINSIKAQRDRGSGGGGSSSSGGKDNLQMTLDRAMYRIEEVTEQQMEKLEQDLSDMNKSIKLEPIEIVPPDMSEWNEFYGEYEEGLNRAKELAAEFTKSVVGGFTDGIQELFDQMAGLEDFNPGRIISALLTPLADMAIHEGEILMASGLGIETLKDALGSLQGIGLVAAGASLIAIGAAAKSGLSALAQTGGRSTSTSTASASSGSSGVSTQDFNTELTVYVKGTIRGSDIVLSGQKTMNNWNR